MGKKKKLKEKKEKLSVEDLKEAKVKKEPKKGLNKEDSEDPKKEAPKVPKKDRKRDAGKKRKPDTKNGHEKQSPYSIEIKTEVIAASEAAGIFRALGDESRMQILRLLEEKEMYGMELLQSVKIVQSTLSHHMKILTDAGIVSCRREGKRALYSICPEKMEQAAAFLKQYRGHGHQSNESEDAAVTG